MALAGRALPFVGESAPLDVAAGRTFSRAQNGHSASFEA
jgi:hypothetical protein